jgi:hypothetical protein
VLFRSGIAGEPQQPNKTALAYAPNRIGRSSEWLNKGSGNTPLLGKREGSRDSIRGPKSRSYDDIALHLLSSRLACLRFGSSNPYIGFHLLSDDPLAYSRYDPYPPDTRLKHEGLKEAGAQ